MVWYYAEGDRQRGPISDEEFQELVVKGRVQEETLIWKDGMASWQPLKNAREAGLVEISPAVPPVSAPMIPPPPVGGSGDGGYVAASASATPAPSQSFAGTSCSQCGRGPLDVGDGVRLGNIVFCQQCDADMERHYHQKAMSRTPGAGWAMQAYGAAATGALTFASIISRAVAKFIDNIIGTVLIVVLMVATTDMSNLGFTFSDFAGGSEEVLLLMRPWLLGSLIFSVLYDAFLVGAFGATLGKMSMGIRVVAADGGRVSWNQAVIRAIAPAVLQLPSVMVPASAWASVAQFVFLFGYVIAALDVERRTLYDHVAGTRVVR